MRIWRPPAQTGAAYLRSGLSHPPKSCIVCRPDSSRACHRGGAGPQARHSQRRRRGSSCSGKNRKREDTLASVAELFIQRHVARLYTRDAESTIRREVMRDRPITSIAKRYLIDMVGGHRQPERQGSPPLPGSLVRQAALWRQYPPSKRPCGERSAASVMSHQGTFMVKNSCRWRCAMRRKTKAKNRL
jgi:hypothetical protein